VPDFKLMLQDHQEVMQSLEELLPQLEAASELVVSCLKSDGKIMLCGNGGSAADSQHIAAEIIGRFETERNALPAIALTTDTSILTAVGNDYGYEKIFSRQVQGLAAKNDILIGYSTSGNSGNVVAAVAAAQEIGCKVITFTGKGGGSLSEMSDVDICVESSNTARIQEAHAFIGHALCAAVDEAF
jgi:D-sedoheptulose 7-phosphate isomerase